MQFFIFVLLGCLLLYFFTLHVLAKEDLIFVRKNVTLESLFNLSFIAMGVGLLSARVVYVLLNFEQGFLNPLVFFLFPYYPGLSFIGGVAGALLCLYLIAKRRRLPIGRIFDFYMLSLLASLPLGFLGTQLLLGFHDLFLTIIMPLIYVVTVIFFANILLPLNVRGEIKDGSLGFLVLMIISFTTLLASIIRTSADINFFLGVENVLYLAIFFVCLAMMVFQERERRGKVR